MAEQTCVPHVKSGFCAALLKCAPGLVLLSLTGVSSAAGYGQEQSSASVPAVVIDEARKDRILSLLKKSFPETAVADSSGNIKPAGTGVAQPTKKSFFKRLFSCGTAKDKQKPAKAKKTKEKKKKAPAAAVNKKSAAVGKQKGGETLKTAVPAPGTRPLPKPVPEKKKNSAETKTAEKKSPEAPGKVVPVSASESPPRRGIVTKTAARVHEVKPGETLPALAGKYYNNRDLWFRIYSANADKIEKGMLKPGVILTIP